MKKSIIAFVLALCMAFVFVGCNSTDATKDHATIDETTANSVPINISLMINAFTYNDLEYQFTLDSGEKDNPTTERFNSIAFIANGGDKVKEVMELAGYSNLKMIEIHDEFLGFMEYKVVPTENDTVTYEKLSDKLYTVEEMMERKVPEYSVVYLARWSKIGEDYYSAYGY